SLLEEKGYDPMVYRFFCLQSHYRRNLVFSWENLDNAATAYKKLVARVASLLKEEQGEVDAKAFDECRAKFDEALANDLNTSLAVTALYDVFKAETNAATKLALVNEFDKVLSLDLVKAASAEKEEAPAADDEFTAEILRLIDERAAAKKAKNFAEADRIRNYLLEKGVTLIDSREGTTFKIGN
ncbi:MAG: cysteine--tRNA ligase, partial [Clostridia bacterium]|nr:cysteine--tRNA ligase [Clostridia bacterium]